MAPYNKKGHSQTLWLTVRLADGSRTQIPTGTHDAATAADMELMLRTLGRRGSRAWDLVTALVEPAARGRGRRLPLARLYDAWKRDQDEPPVPGQPSAMDQLRATLTDVDLAPAIDEWLVYIAAKRSASTKRGYTIRLARLAPLGPDGVRLPLWRSQVTSAWVATMRDRVPGGTPSQLGHLTAWSSCFAWLIERGLLTDNPCAKFKWPVVATRGDRVRHIARLADVQRFVAAFADPQDRAIAALRESTGADWDGIEPMRREHIVDAAQRLVFLPGDKTTNRAREVEVEAWAWPHVAAYVASLPLALPGAPLWTVPYGTYRDHHNRTRDALIAAGVAIPKGYAPHNARHSFAVRKRRAGWSDYKIADYLGNTAREVARTYAPFKPTREDMRQDRAAGGET